jgi:hypothetical protein
MGGGEPYFLQSNVTTDGKLEHRHRCPELADEESNSDIWRSGIQVKPHSTSDGSVNKMGLQLDYFQGNLKPTQFLFSQVLWELCQTPSNHQSSANITVAAFSMAEVLELECASESLRVLLQI